MQRVLRFTKMHGCGNDYIYFDCFSETVDSPEDLAVAVSDRHFGIGGDGIVLICPSETADARMRMFNADGSEGKMCGNAIRCVAKYLYDNKMVQKETVTIDTLSGVKPIRLQTDGGIAYGATVDMGKAEFSPKNVPVNIDADEVVNYPVRLAGETRRITCVSMGNPHCVLFCDDVQGLDLPKIGPLFENDPLFPERVNTEFVRVIDKNTLEMRVWERGSGETMACGTGACATVAAAVRNGICSKGEDVRVILRGGELVIRYTDESVFMTGNAMCVFEGTVPCGK